MPATLCRALIVVLICLGVACDAAHAVDALIVKDGRPNARIVISETPPRSVRLAADELRTYIKRISGATLPITTEPADDGTVNIYVGRSEHTEKLGVSDKGLKHGAYRIAAGAGWMVLIGHDADFVPREPWARNNRDRVSGKLQRQWERITGEKWGVPNGGMYKNRQRMPGHIGKPDGAKTKDGETMTVWTFDERGSFNAVCGFLRDLGVRWYMPGEIGEIVPRIKNIPLPKINKTVRPDFEVRRFNVRLGTVDDQVMKWVMRLGIRNPYGLMVAHGMHDMTHTEAILKQHAEWFALYGGKRDTQLGERLNHLCYSNAELFKHTVRWARAQFDVYDFETVSIMPPDAYIAICQCNLCEGEEAPELGARGKLSNHVWDFVNRVAAEIRKTHPQKKIVCCAYGANTRPPTNIDKLEPNVQVVIVGGRRPRNSKPEQREAIRQLRDGWLAKTENPIIVFENYPFTSRGYYLPAFVPRTIGRSINATKGVSRGEDIWLSFPRYHDDEDLGFDHFQVYFTARMYWGGKDRDVGAMLEEYCRLFYGPAGSQMKAFFEYCEQNWQDMEQDKDKVDQALSLFAAAKAKAEPGSVYARRIARIDRFLDRLRSKAELLAQQRGPVPTLRIPWEPKQPIVIDGKLDDQYWRDCPTAAKGRLRELQTGRLPTFGTSFMSVWHRGSIYFAVRCQERPGEPLNIATKKNEDQSMWYGDAVEIELATDVHSYYQIAVNPAGALVDLDRGVDKSDWFRWQSQAEVAIRVAEDHWTVEIRIPVTEDENDPLNQVIGAKPSRSLPWHFNVCRQRVRKNGSEFSAFSPTGVKSFHAPMKFARIYDGRSHRFEADPSVTDYIIAVAKADELKKDRKHEAALAAYVKLAEDGGVNEFQKSDALRRAAEYARRLDDFERAEALADRIPIDAVAKTVRMQNLLEMRKPGALIEKYESDDITAWPFWIAGEAWLARGRASYETDDGRSAEQDLVRAEPLIADDLTRAGLLLTMGRNREEHLKDADGALAAFRRIADMPGHRGNATYFRGVIETARLLRRKKQFDEALAVLNRVDIDGQRGYWHGALLLALGQTLEAAGQTDDARAAYRKILRDKTTHANHREAAQEAIEAMRP